MTKKKLSLSKIILITLGILILLSVLTVNVVWKIQANYYLEEFCNSLDKEVVGGEVTYHSIENGYSFYANELDYLSFQTNLQITKEPNALGSHDLMIWPNKFGKPTFGADIYDVPANFDPTNPDAETSEDGNSVFIESPEQISVLLDKDGNPIFSEEDTISYKQEAERLISEHREEIDGLFNAAKAKWPELFE